MDAWASLQATLLATDGPSARWEEGLLGGTKRQLDKPDPAEEPRKGAPLSLEVGQLITCLPHPR
jgi:hypothetical protein